MVECGGVGKTDDGIDLGDVTVLTVKSAAERVGVSAGLVYTWIESGVLTHYRVGKPGRRGSIRIAETDLDAFMVTLKRGTVPEIQPLPPKPIRHRIKPKHLTVPG
jgi:excisionase family DNA binding protein